MKSSVLDLRRFWLQVHLWIALAAGMVMVVVGVTGSLLVIGKPLMRAEHGAILFKVAPHAKPFKTMEQWVSAARARYPDLGEPVEVVAPGAGPLSFDAAAVLFVRGEDLILVGVDPYSADVRGAILVGDSWSLLPFLLHTNLLIPFAGSEIISWVAVLTLLSIVSGLCLWWPNVARLGSALRWKRGLRRRAFFWQTHNFVSIYILPVLLIVTASGIWIMRGDWIDPVADAAVPMRMHRAEATHTAADRCAGSVNLNEALTIARNIAPRAELRYVEIPPPPEPYLMKLRKPGDIDSRNGDTHLLIGRRCATVVGRQAPILSASEASRQFMLPLHSGEILPALGPTIVFLSGIAMPVLYITGLYLWWTRRRKASGASQPS